MIFALLLAVVVANAQVPGYNNGGFRYELRSWWNGVWGVQSSFHYGNSSYDTRYKDGYEGASYGFLSNQEWQTARRDNRRVNTAGDSEWALSSDNKETRRFVKAAERRTMDNAAATSDRPLLNREVWQQRRHSGRSLYLGSSSGVNYGRRVKPRNADYGNSAAIGVAQTVTIGSRMNDVKVTKSDGEVSRLTNDNDNNTSGGNFGFGEVPHDDADVPLGDGVWLLVLMAGLYAMKKRL